MFLISLILEAIKYHVFNLGILLPFTNFYFQTFNMAPCNQLRSTVSSIDTWIILLVTQALLLPIAKKIKRVRSTTYANVKLHIDFSRVKPIGPIGPNAKKFGSEVRIVFMRHAPLNVDKWNDISEEQIQQLIDRVLSDVDISRPYINDWMLWKIKSEYKIARREAQGARMMELMTEFASSNIGSFDMDYSLDYLILVKDHTDR
ncbi:hypothetical protein Ddye_019937 [Dipteronia dyeriana]|uniref:Uncharacterized protein n=1 Tax=Dipteronia dyeriana TaxID=168575 RepID=A0AAD9TZB7_9ROSI|nr:hypothetical protein Ddye_019937 [Dipteronia dyeriana]